MLDQSVALVENSVTVTTLLSSLNKRVLLTKMDTCRHTRLIEGKQITGMKQHGKLKIVYVCVCFTQVTLACNDSVTVRTVEFGHILGVFLQNVHLHGSTLGKSGVADVALIWFLS